MTADDVQIYFTTLKEIHWNSERMKENAEYAKHEISAAKQDIQSHNKKSNL